MSDPQDDPKSVTDLSQILPWYETTRGTRGGGKDARRIREIVPLIQASERAGAWLPKVSRAAKSALTKQPAARAFARANEREQSDIVWNNEKQGRDRTGLLEDVRDARDDYKSKL